MKTTQTIEDILFHTLKTNGFADLVAHNIAAQYGEKLMDDFGNQITEALGKYVEKTVEQYVEDYSTTDRIKSRVRSAYNSIDKAELIDIIKGKDWREL